MAYYPDLFPYTYGDAYGAEAENSGLLCVGWLDGAHPFTRGAASPEFVSALKRWCAAKQTAKKRGLHRCNLDECINLPRWPPIYLRYRGRDVVLGGSEIRIHGTGGRRYAAPDLIYHYVHSHSYLPPHDFIDAVCRAVQTQLEPDL